MKPDYPTSQPPEQLPSRPGEQHEMRQQPQSEKSEHVGTGKLRDKVAIISGGDSGIGRAVAVAFAKEGARLAIVYLNEEKDAKDTEHMIREQGGSCLLIKGDLGDDTFSKQVVDKTVDEFGRLDIVVNNAAEQHPQSSLTDITKEQLVKTFATNVFAMFFLTQAALPHLKEGAAIINTTSVTAFKGNPQLIDYASTKGAILGFMRSLALALAEKNIRVNAVAPGPIWTPLIPSTFPPKKVENFGKDTPLGRAGQPEEVAPAYVYLASSDSSYVTGQTIHVNGGSIVNA